MFGYFPRLEERKDQLAGTMSGGEQQMLAIGRAIMSKPRLLMIDEASLGLSPKLAQTVFQVVSQINDDGTTVIIVEQNVGVLPYADQALIMEKGTLTFDGRGRELEESGELRKTYLGETEHDRPHRPRPPDRSPLDDPCPAARTAPASAASAPPSASCSPRLGLLAVAFGWNGAAGQLSVARAGALPAVRRLPRPQPGRPRRRDDRRAGAREDRAQLEAKLDAARRRARRQRRRRPAGGRHGGPAPQDLSGLVVAGTASYHAPGCRLVDGREETGYLTPAEARARALKACRVCQPDTAVPDAARPLAHRAGRRRLSPCGRRRGAQVVADDVLAEPGRVGLEHPAAVARGDARARSRPAPGCRRAGRR